MAAGYATAMSSCVVLQRAEGTRYERMILRRMDDARSIVTRCSASELQADRVRVPPPDLALVVATRISRMLSGSSLGLLQRHLLSISFTDDTHSDSSRRGMARWNDWQRDHSGGSQDGVRRRRESTRANSELYDGGLLVVMPALIESQEFFSLLWMRIPASINGE